MIDKAQNWGVTSQEERGLGQAESEEGTFRVTSCQFTLIIIKYIIGTLQIGLHGLRL